MSQDARVTKDLIETLEDGRKGFAKAAEKLADSDRSDLSAKMTEYSNQRAQFSAELEALAATYGDDIDEDGSVAAAAHRGWMAVKDALTGSSPQGVLDAAEQGEDHAVSEYEDALSKDISDGLRTVVQRQFTAIKQAHDDVKAMRELVS
ncbi:MAG: PA2169 family four-helix-bundle protein [Ilumatobacter sp.]|nr:PA2169 family four-helix-bundle protein [Ilumatobacter sp.]